MARHGKNCCSVVGEAYESTIAAAAVIALAIAIWGNCQWTEPRGLPLPNKPSLAVMPLDDVSGDERLGRLADGMVTGITNNLSRFSGLFDVDRNSAFTY